MADPALVLGLDVGGTSSRALLADASGRRRGTGRSGGGNPTAHGAAPAARAVEAAVRAALGPADPGRVAAVVVGLAGGGLLTTSTEAAAEFGAMWHRVGLTAPVEYVGDALAAYVAGTDRPDGSLLLAGTGAVAARIRGGRDVAHADGYGWLLGDRGSGYWLGHRAVVAAMADLDGSGPATALTGAVVAALLADNTGSGIADTAHAAHTAHHTDDAPDEAPAPEGAPQPRWTSNTLTSAQSRPAVRASDLIVAAGRLGPDGMAGLAPLVTAAHAQGDDVARHIADRAAQLLVDTLGRLRDGADASPVVLAGSILTQDTPVAAGVRAGISRRWPCARVGVGLDGAAGAAWLALGRLGHEVPPDARRRLFQPAGPE